MPAWLYILRLRSGRLYVGCTEDLPARCQANCDGIAGRTTELDPPVRLALSEEYSTLQAARRREAQVKKWTRAKKEALVAGDLAALRRLSKSHDGAGCL